MKLSEITSIITDYVANGSFASLRENAKYVSKEKGYARVIRLTDENNHYSLEDAIFVNYESYCFLSKSKLDSGDIIVTNVGAYLGTVFQCPNLNIPMTLGPNAILIKPNNLVINKYLYYLLNSNYGHRKLLSLISGSAMPKFNKTDLKNLNISIHNKSLQHHIVNTIGSVDNLIENYQSQIEKIIKIGDHLLITDSNKKSIIEYVDVLLGGTPSRKHLEYWNGDIKWINSGAITGTPAILKESDFITIDGVKHSATKSANKGDTVLSIIEPSKSKVALILDDNVYFNQSVICFSSKNKLDKGFIFFASRSLIEEIKGYATGAAQQSLNKEMIEKSKIHVPNQKIKIKLNNFFYSIISLEEKIRKLTILKEMLLLKYF
ncbi:restriction endonuclease subunit S [Metamycoplasma hyosynoviae]|uniref:restriction endonuclease subunit S n=2 Tax=Metamycoplasma hyosynoviae TaxID=29559 RepID=UPI0023618168|nr:restriction endonuclease subunit S [Metamycoplasma hyosynoviae]MDD1361910.1 restriction endonuclease subunit S [Metamycoplasma hyosynoviae]